MAVQDDLDRRIGRIGRIKYLEKADELARAVAVFGSEPPVTVVPSGLWTMMYTSGTTGNPKGVLQSYPSEVEAVIGAHPLVKDVAVVGLPDEKWGERVHAAVVLKEGATLGESELLNWCKDRLAGYKRPRACSFLREEDMPRDATGKVLHRMLKTKLQS